MSTHRRTLLATGATTLLCLVIIAALGVALFRTARHGIAQADEVAASQAAAGNVTPPSCGPGSTPEDGLDGEVPLNDQLDGRAAKGYACNLVSIAQSPNDPAHKAFIQTAFLGNCAYMSTVTANIADSQLTGLDSGVRGSVVVQDFSNPSDPVITGYLSSPAMQNPWESLKSSPVNGLIGAVGVQSNSFDLYHATAADCGHPTLESSLDLPDGYGHAGAFSPDGRFYYATDPPGLTGGEPDPERLQIINVTNPSAPKLVLSWVPPADMYIHDLAISPDGRTAYLAINGFGVTNTGHDPVGDGQNGLLIINTSQIEDGVPNPKLSVIGQVHWNGDTGADQMPVLAKIGGKPYVVVTDEGGNGDAITSTSCPLQYPLGYPRIISLANPAAPAIVGTLRLAIQDPLNCAQALKDHVPYSSHYCAVDNPQNATTIACTWYGSGLRVFNITNPAQPREIAYYNPPTDGLLSELSLTNLSLSNVRFDAAAGELWFANEESGVHILKFTNGAYPVAAAPVAKAKAKAKKAKPKKAKPKKAKKAKTKTKSGTKPKPTSGR